MWENDVEILTDDTCNRATSQKTDSKHNEKKVDGKAEKEINIPFDDIFYQLSYFLGKLQSALQNELPYMVLVQFCKSIVGSPCVYGVNGEMLTLELVEELRRKYPDIYTDDYVLKAYKYLGKICYDRNFICLVAKQHSTHSFYGRCFRLPFRNLSENNIGWLLVDMFWNRSAVSIGDGYCVEARGIDYGIVKCSVYDSRWWGVCKIEGIDYNLEKDRYVDDWLNQIKMLGT